MTRGVVMVDNGMDNTEIKRLDIQFGRVTQEATEAVDIWVDSGYGGVGGRLMKIKEERYL